MTGEVPALGTPRVHLRTTTSTNDRARELAAAGAPHGTVVTAGAQSAGRGRQGRTWTAPPGHALLMSVVLRLPTSHVALLPLAAAVAVAEIAGPQARVKWPNDVLLPGPRPGVVDDVAAAGGQEPAARRKVAGILCEGRPQDGWVVAVIGVNVAVRLDDLPVELRRTAATLARDPADVDLVLGEVLRALRDALSAPAATLLDAWRARDGLRGRTVTWSGGTGTADGIDGAGRLVVRLPDGGRTALDAGEVHLGSGPAAVGPP